jgi:hypothetical protein
MIELKTFMEIFKQTLVDFFRIHHMIDGNKQRVNREMLDNFVTSLVLSGPLYIFVFAILGVTNYEQIMKLQIIIENANVSLQSLKVKDVFQLKRDADEDIIREVMHSSRSN